MHIVILGNGISGITAAIRLRELTDHRITVISSETDYFFSRTALMYIYMGHMRLKDTRPYENSFWKKNNINLVKAHVDEVSLSTQSLIMDNNDRIINYDKLVLATGSAPNRFGWPGQDLDGVSGLYSLQDLDTMEKYSTELDRAVIVGGGLIGIEMAEMFRSRDIKVTMLVRESNYWNNVLPDDEASMVSDHIRSHDVDLRLGSELNSIEGNDRGHVTGVTTNSGDSIDCGFVGLTAGVSPNIGFLKGSGLETDRGILVDDQLRTSDVNVFAVGDCAQIRTPRPGRKPIEAVWYAGRMMGETVAHNVAGRTVNYDPGIWFNSAKFFDIEYQVYGQVPSGQHQDLDSILWMDKGQNRSIRVVFDKEKHNVVGFNLLGVRFRHEVCEKWISQKATLNEVVSNISLAAFDPEFSRQYTGGLVEIYNARFDDSIEARRSSLDRITQFIRS